MADNESNNRKLRPVNDGSTKLHEAAARDDHPSVETLLASGADIHARNARGETALHRSALRGNRETTQTLINAGAQVNARTRQGDTPLHLAASSGSHENIAVLVGAGADRSTRNHNGETPVEVAIARDHKGAMTQGLRTARTDKKMAYLDWMKDRPATQQQSVAKTSQEQTRQAPAAPSQSVAESLSPAQEKTMGEVREVMRKATAHMDKNSAVMTPSAPDGGSNAAQLQKEEGHDKVQAAMSPTDEFAGKTALQEKTATTEKTTTTPSRQTVPRRSPSWER
jgi:ankyrin repeat protein